MEPKQYNVKELKEMVNERKNKIKKLKKDIKSKIDSTRSNAINTNKQLELDSELLGRINALYEAQKSMRKIEKLMEKI